LDKISFLNGIYKYEHSQKTLTVQETQYLKQMLRQELGPFLLKSKNNHVPFECIPDWVVYLSSSGYIFQSVIGPLKRDVLALFTCRYLYLCYLSFTSVLSGTLKDELRNYMKDSRFFRYADICAIVAAIHLFGFQNFYLCQDWLLTHICIGMKTPGADMSILWQTIYDFCGEVRSFDGEQWDAHFQIWGAELICDFRCDFASPEKIEEIQRYYAMMYDGVTNCGGTLLHLIGNSSGHYNTGVDNSLFAIMNVWLYCYRNNISLQDVLFYVCGDDLIITSVDPNFTTKGLQNSSNKNGIYLESISEEATPFYECVFCGTHPVDINGKIRYTYDVVRQTSSLHYCMRGASAFEYFSKLCSITTNLFYSGCYYELMSLVEKFYVTYASLTPEWISTYKSVMYPSLCYSYSLSDVIPLH